jgi:hypothetical protein
MTRSGEPVDQLQHLVLTRLAELGEPGKPMSARAAAKRSHGAVSYDTLYQIANGKHTGRLTDAAAEGIAAALEVPAARVYDAAGAPRPQGRWLLPERFDRLSIQQRRKFEELMNMVLDADAEGYERGRRDAR